MGLRPLGGGAGGGGGVSLGQVNTAIDDALADFEAGATGVVTAAVVGDGVADDTAAINAAITSADALGAVAKVPPGSVCRTSGITVTDKSVRLDLTGVTLVQTANAPILKATSTAANVLSVTAIASESHTMPGGNVGTQSSRLTVSSTTGYAKGDLVRVVSGDPIPGSNPAGGSFRPRLGEFARVGDLDATNIWLAGPLRDTYATNIKVYRVPNRVAEIKGGTLDFADTLDGVNYPGMVELNGYRRISVTDTHVPRALAAAFTTQGCASGRFVGVTSEHGRNVQPDQLGYGIVHLGSENITHIDCRMDGFRHGFTTGGAFMGNNPVTDLHRFGRGSHMTWIGCSANGSLGAGFDVHEEMVDATYIGCSVNGSQQVGDAGSAGFASRGRFIRYFGCHVEGGGTGWQFFSLYGPTARDILMDGCSCVVQGAPISAIGNNAGTSGGTAYDAGTVERVRVTNSRLESLSGTANIVTRAQLAIDADVAWTTGTVTVGGGGGGSTTVNTARRHKNTAQTGLSNGGLGTVSLQAVTYNRGTGLSTATNDAITVTTDGVYRVDAGLAYNGGTSGARCVFIQVNAANRAQEEVQAAGARLNISVPLVLSAGDVVTLGYLQVGGASLNGTNNYDCWLSVTRVGD